MIERTRVRLLAAVLASLAPMALPGCVGPAYVAAPRRYPPYYYDYYYYPDVGVYFHLYSGWYYYRDHGRWLRVRRLPPHIHLHPQQRYVLRGPEKEPWRHYEEHRRKYPPRALPRQTPAPRTAPAPDRRLLRPPDGDGRGGLRSTPAPSPGAPRVQPDRRRAVPPAARREEQFDREERDRNSHQYDEYRRRPLRER